MIENFVLKNGNTSIIPNGSIEEITQEGTNLLKIKIDPNTSLPNATVLGGNLTWEGQKDGNDVSGAGIITEIKSATITFKNNSSL